MFCGKRIYDDWHINVQRNLHHIFAASCIEQGVNIPTVSRWLGHQDGGALCMKTYGHLRDEHSRRRRLK
jgi:integrase